MTYHIPIRLPSLANARLHWKRLAALKKQQRAATLHAILGLPYRPKTYRYPTSPPLIVTITRAGPRKLDDDNLAAACKYVRDQIAAIVGVDDGSPLYTWRYAQRKGEYGVDVTIEPRWN